MHVLKSSLVELVSKGSLVLIVKPSLLLFCADLLQRWLCAGEARDISDSAAVGAACLFPAWWGRWYRHQPTKATHAQYISGSFPWHRSSAPGEGVEMKMLLLLLLLLFCCCCCCCFCCCCCCHFCCCCFCCRCFWWYCCSTGINKLRCLPTKNGAQYLWDR